jgi:hypothetical protein
VSGRLSANPSGLVLKLRTAATCSWGLIPSEPSNTIFVGRHVPVHHQPHLLDDPTPRRSTTITQYRRPLLRPIVDCRACMAWANPAVCRRGRGQTEVKMTQDTPESAQTPVPLQFRARRASVLTVLLLAALLLGGELALQWGRRRGVPLPAAPVLGFNHSSSQISVMPCSRLAPTPAGSGCDML